MPSWINTVLPASHRWLLSEASDAFDEQQRLYNVAIVGKSNGTDTLSISPSSAVEFDIDMRLGFLADRPALRLPKQAVPWEAAWIASRNVGLHSADARARKWRKDIERLDIIDDTSFLHSAPLLRRAHALLAFLVHRYVHSLPDTKDVPTVPDALAVPFLHVSRALDLPPVLTYADTVLWNWTLKDDHGGFTWDNLEIIFSFTDTPSERWFYLVSAMIEFIGAPALRIMSATLDEAFFNDATSRLRIVDYLYSLAPHIDACTAVLAATRIACDPAAFYYEQRPWYNGREVIMAGERQKWSGPSAGQSSYIHSLDAFLGVEHSHPGNTDTSTAPSFMAKMQCYMPLPHRIFLTHLLDEARSIRQLAKENEPLRRAYDTCVEALRRLRDEHMRIVGTYIIHFARRESKGTSSDVPSAPEPEPRGTGGTDIGVFLQSTRKATIDARLSYR